MVCGVPCMCIATQPTPNSAATGQRLAEMSLISVAPAATAARATDALRVSIETRARSDSASITGMTRRSSSASGYRRGPGSRRLTADVDDCRAFVDQLKAVCDREIGFEPLTAVRERVRRDVHDPHDADERAANWRLDRHYLSEEAPISPKGVSRGCRR